MSIQIDGNYDISRWESIQRMSASKLAMHILWWQATMGLLGLIAVLPIGLAAWIVSLASLRASISGCLMFGLLFGLACAFRYSRLPRHDAGKAFFGVLYDK